MRFSFSDNKERGESYFSLDRNEKVLTGYMMCDIVNYTSNELDNEQSGREAHYLQLNDDKSIYLQIGQMIEDSILRGIFLEGERVPSTNELARLYSINPATAAKGINLLVEQEILYKKRGIGMFVNEGAVEKIRLARKAGFYEQFVVNLISEAKALGITKEELVEMIRRAEHDHPTEKGVSAR